MRLVLLIAALCSGALAGALREKRDAGCVCPQAYGPQARAMGGFGGGPGAGGYWAGGMTGRSAFLDPAIVEGRLLNQAARIAHMEEDFEVLAHEYEEWVSKKGERKDKFQQLEDRIWNLELHHCDDEHFSCRDEIFTCIGHNLVCDNRTDCRNGRDEHPDTCHVATGIGSVFEGLILHEDTCSSRKPNKFRFAITDVDINPAFPSEPHIRSSVLVTSEVDHEEVETALNSEGIFDYTHHRLYLYSPDKDHLVFTCTFPEHNDDHCRATFQKSNGEVCAEFGMRRLDH